MSLADAIRGGDRMALARGLTRVESGGEAAAALLAALPAPMHAHRIGVTGPPGAGKSTLCSVLTSAWRARDRTVGILAVDPSSPFTGGALLGDRVRMLGHSGDAHVFIRSLASRGAYGGLAAVIYDAVDLLDAAGFDPVLIETVGVGQGEVEICRVADTTVVVLAPGAGDVVQGMKAGLVEAADALVVNQADRAGADTLVAALRSACELRDALAPPIFTTVATGDRGIDELRAWLDERPASAEAALAARRLERSRSRIRAAVDRARGETFWSAHAEALEEAAAALAAGRMTAPQAVRQLLEGGGA
jgi:LAO/AO transport system kinase